MPEPQSERTPPVDSAAQAVLIRAIMGRQAALSIRVAAVFLILIFGLPIVNWLLPELAGTRVGGFTLTWLFLGVLFYPLTWLLSGYFVRESDRLEAEIVAEYKGGIGGARG
ncbi:MAG: DUF485 domain-containing protein [Akkermansiaceae bacterium]|nr:DUF485 domain-containing protein [Armatimonadota bacterium]